MFCLFLSSKTPAELAVPPCRRALALRPARAFDPYLDDGPAPARVVQLYFDSLAELEAAAAGLCAPWSAEAMTVQPFAVRDPEIRSSSGRYCTYLVTYAGPAEDEAKWRAEYLAHHPRLMAKLPGIRELEVYLPVDWCAPASLARVRHLQRNKVAFDSAEALTAALNSPARSEMHRHFRALPPFSGAVTHFAMTTAPL